MASIKASSRYNSYYDSRSSSASNLSDPSSSFDFNHKSSSSRAIVKSKHSAPLQAANKTKPDPGLATIVRKLMEKKSSLKPKASNSTGLVIPSDFIAQDLKKNVRKVTGFTALQKKLFGKEMPEKKKEVKALTEVKGNTRTLAMVLRSERELLNMNKEQEQEIAELKLMLEEKNSEMEKLKDLCLKQREEIKSLKNAVFFPDLRNSQLEELLERQGSELKQAKQVIPSLERQVTSLSGQLQSLAKDLAEVKADKHSGRTCLQNHCNSPMTPAQACEDITNSLEFTSGDLTTSVSPDDLFVKDLNPCLTPYSIKSGSSEFEGMNSKSVLDDSLSKREMHSHYGIGFNSFSQKLTKSADSCKNSSSSKTAKASHRSVENKTTYGKQMHHKF